MSKQDFNIGNLIADQYKDTEHASTEQEAMGIKNELEYPDPVEQTTEEPSKKEEPKEEKETPKEEVKDKAEETKENESAEETESSLNTEESDKSETKEEPTIDLDVTISERTEGKYESLEDLIEAANTPKEETKFEYGNELIAKLDELQKQGVDVNLEFIKAQMADYNKYDVEDVSQAKQLIEMKLRQEEPDITQREIEFELSKYKLDADEYDENDVELSKIKLMRDAKKARKDLISNQEKMAIPTGGVDPEVQRQAEEKQRQIQERVTSELKDAVKSYEKETLKIGDESFDYELTAADKKSLEKSMLNTDTFFHKYINKDGTINSQQLRSDMLWLTHKDQMLNAFLQQATAKGTKDVVENIKNTDFSHKKSQTERKDTSVHGAIGNHFNKKFN